MAGTAVIVYDNVALASLGATVPSMTSEDTASPRANLVHPDRKVRARTIASPAGSIDIQIDLGVARTVTGFGVHYLVSDAAASAHPAMNLMSGSSFGGVASRITQTAAFWNTSKDWVNVIASVSDRYWILRCTSVTARFALGAVILGTGKTVQIMTGTEYQVVTPNARAEASDHSVVDMPQGSPYRVYDLRFFAVTDPDVAAFEQIARQLVPWSLLDSRGNSNHVVNGSPEGSPFQAAFDPMWNVRIAARQMP